MRNGLLWKHPQAYLTENTSLANRDVKKPNENPSVGLILCTYKDDTVVEYALSSSLSPAMVADYTLQLPDKKLLEAKLREIAMLTEENDEE